MSVFAIMCLDGRDEIQKKANQLGLPLQNVAKEGLLVSFKGTSEELAAQLGISEGQTGRAVVISISSYYGFAPQSLWEWINVHWND